MGSVDLLVCSTSRPVESFEKALTYGFTLVLPVPGVGLGGEKTTPLVLYGPVDGHSLKSSALAVIRRLCRGFSLRLPFLAIHVQRVACVSEKAKRRNTRYVPTGVRHRWSSP